MPNPVHLLLVEDDPKLAEILAVALSTDGIEMAHALNGPEALEKIRTTKFDVVLLDLGLPAMSGFEVLQRIKSTPSPHEPPVIVLTAWHGTQDKLRSFELGAVDYVTKPFELAELRARVRATVKTKRLQDELRDTNRELDAARLTAE